MNINQEIEENTRLTDLKESKRALLVETYRTSKEKDQSLEHLQELESLADTYGLETVEKLNVPIKKIESSTYIGKGKILEMEQLCNEKAIDIIVFDMEILPHQQRNLEKSLKKIVIDRTELIIGVFAIHAKTREAKLQIELAQLEYELPRLKRMWTHLSRQRISGKSKGYLKGAGEKQIEMDRQRLKTRISLLQKEIEKVIEHRKLQRKQRKKANIPTFAIVGYTNSGKSTLMNALCDAKVLVEDKLFATLDTTTRKFILPNNQQILLIDTVGFIRKLPHTLVAAFKSTLEEAVFSDIILHLIDMSSPAAKDMAIESLKVLKELKADDKPIITCLNKMDACTDRSLISFFKIQYPKTVAISALKRQSFEQLMDLMMHEISNLRKVVKLKIPQSYYKSVSEIIRQGRIISIDYIENDIIIEAEVPKMLESKLSQFIL